MIQPAASTACRSGVPGRSAGFELLMWTKTLLPDPERGERGDGAVRPDIDMWPMRCPVFWPRPCADHLVVAPERAVEEHEVGAAQPLRERRA